MNIGIFTNFMDFNPGYSLTGIVTDQAIMLDRFGHKVFLFVNEQYNPQYDVPIPAERLKVVPFEHLRDYANEATLEPKHNKYADKISAMLVKELTEREIEVAFTHDWIFTGWNLPYSIAIRRASPKLPSVRWFHWIHSVPSVMRDWWQIRRYGPNHKIIYPNVTEKIRVAEQYRGTVNDVRVIPHIKDLRTWYDFDKETCRFIDDYPGVMQADFVQVYPASTDRLEAKRVDVVAAIFGQLKRNGSVCLVIANQWATGKVPKQNVEQFYRRAEQAGLKRDEEFIFTSEWDEKYATGIPRVILRELQLCSNLFIFPTKEESFGLVGPEAALAATLPVLNKSLHMMQEVFGGHGIYNDYGSHHQDLSMQNAQQYYRDIAAIILGRLMQNEVVLAKTYSRQRYNFDSLYLNYYEPLIAESKLWAKQLR